MSNTNEFLPEYDPNAVDKLNETLDSQPLNRTIGVKTSQRATKPKKEVKEYIDKGEGKKALDAIREVMGK